MPVLSSPSAVLVHGQTNHTISTASKTLLYQTLAMFDLTILVLTMSVNAKLRPGKAVEWSSARCVLACHD